MACETLLTTGLVVVAGEISTQCYVDIPSLVRDVVCDIGYDSDAHGFNGRTCGVMVALDEQSPDIAQGVTAAHELRTRLGRRGPAQRPGRGRPGDDVRLRLRRDARPHAAADLAGAPAGPAPGPGAAGRACCPYLRPDGKTQVSVVYEDGRPVAIDTVLISTQHAPGRRHRDAACCPTCAST